MEHSKRYMVIFNIWSDKTFKETKTEYDNIKDVKEEINLIDEIYKDTPVPIKVLYDKSRDYNQKRLGFSNYAISYEGNRRYWGYAVLDFEKQEVLKYGHDGLLKFDKKSNQLIVKDNFFRGENEVPKGYKWDVGEYEGWLQFRWGDGKNAIDYVEPIKEKSKKELQNQNLSEETLSDNDLIQQKYDDILDKENVKRLQDRW